MSRVLVPDLLGGAMGQLFCGLPWYGLGILAWPSCVTGGTLSPGTEGSAY